MLDKHPLYEISECLVGIYHAYQRGNLRLSSYLTLLNISPFAQFNLGFIELWQTIAICRHKNINQHYQN